MEKDENGNIIPGTEEVSGAEPEEEAAVTEEAAEEQPLEEIPGGEAEGAEPPKGAKKRIDRLVAERNEAREREAYWRGLAEGKQPSSEQRAQEAPPPDVPPQPPDPTNYESGIYDTRYIEDHDQYLIDAAAFRMERKAQEKAEREKEMSVRNKFMSKMKEASVDDPTIMDVMKDPTFFPHSRPEAGPLVALIRESDEAPEILKYLYNHRDELEKMYLMGPLAAAREIGKIEIKVKGPERPVRKISQAPKPIETVGGKGTVETPLDDDDKLPMSEFMRRRNERQYGKRR